MSNDSTFYLNFTSSSGKGKIGYPKKYAKKINTYLKEEIADIMFGEIPLKKKRIAIRKLKNKKLSKEYITLFLRLIEYMSEV